MHAARPIPHRVKIENQSLKKLQHLPESQTLRDDAQTASDYASDTLRHRTSGPGR
jgi:hypothetical protein